MLRKMMLNSVSFILGFSVVFITLGAISTEVGQLLARYKSSLAQVAGVVIILFGLHLTGIFRINALYADKRLHNVKGGSTPGRSIPHRLCFRFRLDSLRGADSGCDPGVCRRSGLRRQGNLLLSIYSMGLAVPFLLTSFAIERFLKFYGRFKTFMHGLEVASGAFADRIRRSAGGRTLYHHLELSFFLKSLCPVVGSRPLKRDPVVIIVVAMVVSLMLVFGFNMARKSKNNSVPGPQAKGDTAPDFTLQSLDGKNTRLSDFRGQGRVA